MTVIAYLDPGSGSLVLQLILGGIAGAAGAFKVFSSRLRRRKARGDSAQEQTEEAKAHD